MNSIEKIETSEKEESININVFLQEDEYNVELILYSNNIIEFKVKLTNPTASCYYTEKYNLEEIKEKASLFHQDMKAVYGFYKRKFQNRKINLLLSEDKKMNIYYKTITDDEEMEVKLELKKIDLKEEDKVDFLAKEVEQLKKRNKELENKIDELQKKQNDLLMIEHNKKIEKEKEEQQKKIDKEKIEEQRQKDEEMFSAMNDNLNLTNNFDFKNFDTLQNIDTIPIYFMQPKTVAVFCIIKNNKRLYQMAYPKCKIYDQYNKQSYIIIYNIITNKIDNLINCRGREPIQKLKHYYDSFKKRHILLGIQFPECISLWNITPSTYIEEIFYLSYSEYKVYFYNACILFKDEKFLIFATDQSKKIVCYDDKKNQKKSIDNSQISNFDYIETSYIKDKDEEKIYILLAGSDSSGKLYFSECYDNDTGKIINTYNNNDDKEINCINLFKKGDDIFLINSTNDKVNIFNFKTAELKGIILIGNYVRSLCSISQKYIIVSSASELKIIDMEKQSIVPKSSFYAHYDGNENHVLGIEKIKIPEKGEFMITYSPMCIKIWKI